MNKAADYTSRLKWLKVVRPTDSTYGNKLDTYETNGYLRCAVDESSGQRQTEDGSIQTGARGTIRIRQYPSFTALDLLYDEAFGYVWQVESLYVGNNELVCDAFRLDNDSIDNYTVDA